MRRTMIQAAVLLAAAAIAVSAAAQPDEHHPGDQPTSAPAAGMSGGGMMGMMMGMMGQMTGQNQQMSANMDKMMQSVTAMQNEKDPANALVSQQLWFDDLPAVMRVRITTPNVLKVLRKRNPEVAKPYNFVLSPILIQPPADCTLIAPASKHPEEWLTREYIEIHSGELVKLGSEYCGFRKF